MSQPLAVQLCRIIAPDKLSDRFLASGVLRQEEDWSLSKQPLLLYVFEINRPWFPSSPVIPSLVSVLQEQHAQLRTDQDLGDQFELLLRAVNQQLNSLSEQGETDWIGNLNGLIVVLGGEELHFSQTGSSPAYLLQNNRIRQITEEAGESEPHPLKTFSNLASGVLKPDDQLLIANHELYREVSLDALRRIISKATPYQASQTITKELKRSKNPGVCSAIIRICAEEASTAHPEPSEIFLEIEMESSARKLQRRLAPTIAALNVFGRKAGEVSLKAAKRTHALVKDTVAPEAAKMIKKGAAGAKNLTDQVVSKIGHVEQKPETPLIVERILPTTKPKVTLPEEGSTPMEEIEHQQLRQSPLDHAGRWFSSTKNRKITALGIAALLITITIGVAVARHKPTTSPEVQSKNTQDIQTATSLETKATTAISLSQQIEGAKEIQQAQQLVDGLETPDAAQQKTVAALQTTLTAQSDSLTATTRLTTAATYQFPTSSKGLIANSPYFYGFGSQGLIRTGAGDQTQTQTTVAVPDPSDNIISFVQSNESDTAGYALTLQDKVYRIVQNNSDTELQAIAPGDGSAFAKGDLISTYIGNVYILDKVSGILWKYVNTGTAYNKGVSVIDKSKYDITNSVSLAIDGSIYILKNNGSLLKFTSGQQDTTFSLKNLPYLSQKMTQPLSVITDDTMQSIYVLDGGLTSGTRSTAKVLEFTKDGTFVREYGFPANLTNITAFDIDPKNKKLWVLSNQQISEFNI